jgi:hypothetical protein
MNAYRSIDDGEDIVRTRLSYADAIAGTDTFCLWSARFADDDWVAGYGATLPQAAADLHRSRRDTVNFSTGRTENFSTSPMERTSP